MSRGTRLGKFTDHNVNQAPMVCNIIWSQINIQHKIICKYAHSYEPFIASEKLSYRKCRNTLYPLLPFTQTTSSHSHLSKCRLVRCRLHFGEGRLAEYHVKGQPWYKLLHLGAKMWPGAHGAHHASSHTSPASSGHYHILLTPGGGRGVSEWKNDRRDRRWNEDLVINLSETCPINYKVKK